VDAWKLPQKTKRYLGAGIPLRKGILLGVILGHGRYYQQYSHGVKSDAPSG